MRKPNGYWAQPERLKEAAAQYPTRSTFRKGNGSAYIIAWRMGILDTVCEHMKRQCSLAKRGVYAFEFPNKTCYIGLTYNFDKRYVEHTQEKGAVFNYIQQHENVVFEFKKLSEYIDPEEAAKLEAETIEKYKLEGWILLNRVKAGGLGSTRRIWNKEKCKLEALKYKTRGQFQYEEAGAYNAAKKNGWFDEITSHIPKFTPGPSKWNTLEKVQVAALKYKTRNEFKKKNKGAYDAARKNGWLSKVTSHMPENVLIKWDTLEKVRTAALKYKTRMEFRKENAGAYDAALRKGWLSEVTSHMPENVSVKWDTIDKVKVISSKYETRNEFRIKATGAYQSALKHGWMDILFPKTKTRTLSEVRIVASGCKTRSEFYRKARSAYNSALRHGWMDILFPKTKTSNDKE